LKTSHFIIQVSFNAVALT